VFGRAETIHQLDESLRLLERAVAATPERWHRPAPGEGPPDFWGVAMNLAHLALYEENHPVPVLEALAAGAPEPPAATSGEAAEAETAALAAEPLEGILDRLRAARQRQVAALRAMTDQRFATATTLRWGRHPKPAAWVAAKTVQHTWEHGNTVMQIALFFPP
jgi:DinB superfamily